MIRAMSGVHSAGFLSNTMHSKRLMEVGRSMERLWLHRNQKSKRSCSDRDGMGWYYSHGYSRCR